MTILQNAGLETAASRHLKTDAQLDKFLTLLDAKGLSSLKDAPAVAKCFRDSQLKGAPPQAQTRAQRAPSRRRPANEVTGDSAGVLLDMTRKQGQFKGKSDGYINDFRKYMADHDTDDLNPKEVDKALAKFRALRAGALAQARPGLVKTPGVHGGGLGKRREAPLLEANTFGADGMTCLMRAVKDSKTTAGKTKEIKDLLGNGADPTLIAPPRDKQNRAIPGVQRSAELYLESLADSSKPPVNFVEDVVFHLYPSRYDTAAETRSHSGQNALTMAIACGAPQEVVESICIWTVSKKKGEKGSDLINEPDGNGNRPLTLAIETNNAPACDTLLKRGAEVNIANGGNRTPLMLAAQKNNLKLVTKLMEQGANSLPVVPDQMTPLSLALVGVNKEEVAKRADVLHFLLDAVPGDFASLCQSVNEESEAGVKSDAAEILGSLVQTLYSFEGEAFEDSPVKAHAADCLTGCLTIATQSLSGVQLLELLPHLKGPALDRMEQVVSEKLPRDLERMVGPPAASARLWIKTSKAFDKYAEFAEKNVRPIWYGLDRIHMTPALESICKTSSVSDALIVLEFIVQSDKTITLNQSALRLLTERLPKAWEKLFSSCFNKEPGSEERLRELKTCLIATLRRLFVLRGRPIFHPHPWDAFSDLGVHVEASGMAISSSAFLNLSSAQLAEIFNGVGELLKRQDAGKAIVAGFHLGLWNRRKRLEQLNKQKEGDTIVAAADLYVDSFCGTLLFIKELGDVLSGMDRSTARLSLVKGYLDLKKETRKAVIKRLDKPQLSALRFFIEETKNHDAALKEFDKFLKEM